MKILFVITGLGMGGAEKVVVTLADALAGKGHRIKIAFLTGSASVLPVSSDVQVIDLGVKSPKDIFLAYFKLRKIIVAFNPDVVTSHLVHANILTRLLRLTTPMRRLISSAHNNNEGNYLRMLAYRCTDRLADISTNVSNEAVATFVKNKAVKPGRMVTMYNGISINEFHFSSSSRCEIRCEFDIADDCNLILAVGRLNKPKDYPNLFKALNKINSHKFNYKVLIAGDGALKNELITILDKFNMTDKVKFIGIRRDIDKLMSAADVFVLASAWEGFGLVVAEAMACERVVVATDCGGVKEVVGDAGYLVKTRDSKALAGALEAALHLNADQRSAIGRVARQRIIDYYMLDKVVEKWLQLYTATPK